LAAVTAALLPGGSTWAAPRAAACSPDARWRDFTSLDLTVQRRDRQGRDDPAARLEFDVDADGTRLVGDFGPWHGEMIELSQAGHRLILASDPTVPLQLGEASTLIEVPTQILEQRFHDACALRSGVRYPIAQTSRNGKVTGEAQRSGSVTRFAFQVPGEHDGMTYSGTITHAARPPRLSPKLPIRGWTIFRDSVHAEDGQPSTFETLGDFEASPTAAAAP
jgi:hypothetical protein